MNNTYSSPPLVCGGVVFTHFDIHVLRQKLDELELIKFVAIQFATLPPLIEKGGIAGARDDFGSVDGVAAVHVMFAPRGGHRVLQGHAYAWHTRA